MDYVHIGMLVEKRIEKKFGKTETLGKKLNGIKMDKRR